VIPVIDDSGVTRQVPIPPDLDMLRRIAAVSGGQAVVARSAAELDTVLGDLVQRTGLAGGQRDMTLPFAAAALLQRRASHANPSRVCAGGPARRMAVRDRRREQRRLPGHGGAVQASDG
jgi:hypothetical protein